MESANDTLPATQEKAQTAASLRALISELSEAALGLTSIEQSQQRGSQLLASKSFEVVARPLFMSVDSSTALRSAVSVRARQPNMNASPHHECTPAALLGVARNCIVLELYWLVREL